MCTLSYYSWQKAECRGNDSVPMDPFKILRKNAEVTKQSLYNTIMHCSPNVLQLCPTYVHESSSPPFHMATQSRLALKFVHTVHTGP